MQSKAATVEEYLASLPADRQAPMRKLRSVIRKNVPKGFAEIMSYGMIGYVVPHKLYPAGYHCDPKLPLPFMNIASQKHFIAVYHMGIYADSAMLKWFTSSYARDFPQRKLDMGKSCQRYKKAEDIPFELIGELAAKITPQQWIKLYETIFRDSRRRA